MQQPLTPVIVRVVEPPTRETSVADILIGAVGFVGFVLLMAALVGLVLGGLFIAYKKLFPHNTFNGEEEQRITLDLSR
jgi:hypothetical protein